ncbi:hypothetical protein [Saccharibacillus sacchari]|uniref:hypothetical protein n=1 Tax=Saccharibacillus sacchari TaxID=456493 RepID=UPI0012EB8AA4|nr:hypothetical protein [Saccharibacillus sacchari]
MAENPCPIYAQHQMRSQGFASVKDESGAKINQLDGGGWFKCGCGERFISWGSPQSRLPIVYYATEGAIVGSNGASTGIGAFTVKRSLVRFTESNTLPGYMFL